MSSEDSSRPAYNETPDAGYSPKSDAAADAGAEQTSDAARRAVSPLCIQKPGACELDDATSCGAKGTTGALDAGSVDGGSALGCRLDVDVATCMSTGTKEDGELCLSSDECDVGLECIGKPGVCRRYCCAGQCDEKEFCSIESRAGSEDVSSLYASRAPVCVPVRACKLLTPKEACSANETCSVVDDNGTTSCVSIGPRLPGQSCELENCVNGSICLGTLGSRTCLKLCDTSDDECGKGEKCRGSAPLFQEVGAGVCQKTMTP